MFWGTKQNTFNSMENRKREVWWYVQQEISEREVALTFNWLLSLAEELFLLARRFPLPSQRLMTQKHAQDCPLGLKRTMISETQTQETYHNTRPGKRITSKNVQLYSTRSRLSSRRAWELGLISRSFSGLAGLSDSQESGWGLAPDKTRIFWNPQDNVWISLR